MSQDIDFKYTTRNIYRTVLEDGLLEMMLVVYIVLSGILIGIVFMLSKMIDTHGLLILLGVCVAIIGIVVFTRFIQECPIQPVDIEGVPDVN